MDRIDFQSIAHQALMHARELLSSWLPGGSVSGYEYIVCNPTRDDKRPGSFRVNIKTGRWAEAVVWSSRQAMRVNTSQLMATGESVAAIMRWPNNLGCR